MSNLGLLLVGIALPFIAAGLCAIGLYLAHRRRKTFAKVQGLYLETTVFKAPTPAAQVAAAAHVCTFKPCPHLEREAARQGAADRLKGGGR